MCENLNIYGKKLKSCSFDPITGFTRNGYCESCLGDNGKHFVCVLLTDSFLNFSKNRGNNLRSIGLKSGNFWCICVFRWIEAYKYDPNIAPKINLDATNINVSNFIPKNILLKYKLK